MVEQRLESEIEISAPIYRDFFISVRNAILRYSSKIDHEATLSKFSIHTCNGNLKTTTTCSLEEIETKISPKEEIDNYNFLIIFSKDTMFLNVTCSISMNSSKYLNVSCLDNVIRDSIHKDIIQIISEHNNQLEKTSEENKKLEKIIDFIKRFWLQLSVGIGIVAGLVTIIEFLKKN